MSVTCPRSSRQRPRFAADLRAALDCLRPLRIGAEGQLLEFGDDFAECEIHRRHVSHLYGAYPGCEITRDGTPALWQAVRTSLNRRGDKSTGWAMGWRVALWARLRDGDRALRVMGALLTWVPPRGDTNNRGALAAFRALPWSRQGQAKPHHLGSPCERALKSAMRPAGREKSPVSRRRALWYYAPHGSAIQGR